MPCAYPRPEDKYTSCFATVITHEPWAVRNPAVVAQILSAKPPSDRRLVNKSFLKNLKPVRFSSARLNKHRVAKFKPVFILRSRHHIASRCEPVSLTAS